MDLLLQLLQFLLRLAFGLALGMALVSPKQVTSGYFRNTLYVILGLSAFSTLICFTESLKLAAWLSGAVVVASYVGSVMWLYEQQRSGRIMLIVVALLALAAAWTATPDYLATPPSSPPPVETSISDVPVNYTNAFLRHANAPAGGAVLGITMAAMLLGHWYLNSPTMQIAPLVRLLAWMAVALSIRAVISLVGLGLEWQRGLSFDGLQLAFLAIRWLSGLAGPMLLTWMAWRTLKIPNTQSATGILYVAVITTFTGELSAQLLSAQTLYPL